MKNILTVTLLLFTMLGAAYAQEEKSAAELKNEGNAAYRTKDYKTALTSYEAAIEAWDEAEDMDPKMIYATAACARKLKNYEKSLKYYTEAKELGYNEDVCTYYCGAAHKSMGNMDKMEETMLAGLEEFPNSKYVGYMKKALSTHYVKQANAFYVKGQNLLNTRTEANRDKWAAIKVSAKVELDKAIALAEKTLSYSSTNSAAKTIIAKVPELLKN